jgi:WD40 repeat protein
VANGFTYDVFLSHNSQDKPRVRKLAERLKDAGLRVWFDDWVIKPGDDIYLAIERGLEAARVQVLCLSPDALGSAWVTLERSTVLFRDPANIGRRFVPLLLADCTLPDTLRRYRYVDFRQETETAFGELLVACRGEEQAAILPPKKKPTTRKRKPAKQPPEQREPLAVWERRLKGHTWTNSVAFSPDGTSVASGGGSSSDPDPTVKIWDLETGKCRATLTGHTDNVNCVAITSDGKRILSGANDHTLRVWDVSKRKQLASWQASKHFVTSVVPLSSERAMSAGAAGDPVLKIWDMVSQQCLATLKGHSNAVRCVAVSKDEKRAVSGSFDNTIRVWNLETNQCLATLTGHSDVVYSIQITPDGRFAVSGSLDKAVKVWDLETRTCIGTLEGHHDKVHAVAISPDGTLIASTGFIDHTVRIWKWKSGKCLQIIRQSASWTPISIAFSPDGSRLVVGMAGPPDGIMVYRLTTTRPAPSPEPTRRYVNAKVVLLGEGTVGKTSLAHRLIEDKYVVKDRTHGMNVWPLELPLLPHATIDREVLLWDLAGQEDYRLIHRLFLDETALALLLINPQKDDPFAEAGDWLRALDMTAGDAAAKRQAARLLVFSQIDVGGMKLGSPKIDRFIEQHRFASWLATSAKTGENCSDEANEGKPSKLKQLITEHIAWDALPWTATPQMLAELKGAVLTMRSKTDIRLLRFAELMQRLEQSLPGQKFDESDVRTAVTLLGNHGLVRPLKFGDLILLQPELLSGYAGAIIRSARAHRDEIGCVLEKDIYDPHFDFTGVDRLPRADEELLLRALVQTLLDRSLCIAEETPQGRQLVFPSQYRRERDIPRDPDIFVSYTFEGEWQTIWTTLVVRLWYSQEFEHRELWRNAAEFASSRGHLLGLKIDNRQGEGEATVSLFFDVRTPDELKVIFIEYVHRHLARYGCNVTRDRRYVCVACSTPVTDLEMVRKRFAAEKDFITCQNCDEQVLLVDFIEQRLKSDPVARKILAMEETATRQLDTQALEQILIGHVQAITGEANQIFRTLTQFDYGIDGEIEFKDDDGRASGQKVYVQLKSGNSYLRTRKSDGREVFDAKDGRHLEYWIAQPVDVYLVIRQTDEKTGNDTIRWMNVTRYLRNRKDKQSRQIIFEGENLTMESVWRLRDGFFPVRRDRAQAR